MLYTLYICTVHTFMHDQSKNAFRKAMQAGLVETCSNKTANVQHPNIQHRASLQPYFTLSTIVYVYIWYGPSKCQSLHVKMLADNHC